jgi:hypothetical protein
MTAPTDSRRQFLDTAIDPARLYRSDEVAARMGWRPSGWRAARRAGLRAFRYGKRWFVRGADVIAFVEQHGGDET